MIFFVYDSNETLRCVSQVWPIARSALDTIVAEDGGCPRLEIHPNADFGWSSNKEKETVIAHCFHFYYFILFSSLMKF